MGLPSSSFLKEVTFSPVFRKPSFIKSLQDGSFTTAVPVTNLTASILSNTYLMTAMQASVVYPLCWCVERVQYPRLYSDCLSLLIAIYPTTFLEVFSCTGRKLSPCEHQLVISFTSRSPVGKGWSE